MSQDVLSGLTVSCHVRISHRTLKGDLTSAVQGSAVQQCTPFDKVVVLRWENSSSCKFGIPIDAHGGDTTEAINKPPLRNCSRCGTGPLGQLSTHTFKILSLISHTVCATGYTESFVAICRSR